MQVSVSGSLPPRKRPRSLKWHWLLYSFLASLFITGVLVTLYILLEEKPNQTQVAAYPEAVELETGQLLPLISSGELMDWKALVEGTEIYLPFDLLKEKVDPYIFLDEDSEQVVITNEHQVFTLHQAVLHEHLKDEQVALQFPVRNIDGVIYIPMTPLADIYSLTLKKFDQFQVVELVEANEPWLSGEVIFPEKEKEEAKEFVRIGPSYQEPYVQEVASGQKVRIFAEKNQWYKVQTEEGAIGYLPKEFVQLKELVMVQKEEQPRDKTGYAPWKPLGKKINLTWEHVVSRSPDPDSIAPPPGVHVVSPTWFHLADDQGQLKNLADTRYVDWAHRNGYQVWALVTNDFNPDRTHAVLSSFEKRKNVILQLVHFAQIYQLDGINIDFENVYLKDRENLVQFVRELTPYLHEMGLVVSIDVTIKSTSEMWSQFLDRKALAETVDYVMVMTYDEHWASSPKAGSVASLPWVERGLLGVLEEVPNEKLLLGIPFYTRLWKEEVNEQGERVVSSKAYSMPAIETWLADRGVTPTLDEATGQYYAEYVDEQENAVYKVWLENEHSVRQRVELVHKYNLAGVASWRRGFEKPVIWEVIEKHLN